MNEIFISRRGWDFGAIVGNPELEDQVEAIEAQRFLHSLTNPETDVERAVYREVLDFYERYTEAGFKVVATDNILELAASYGAKAA